MTVKDSRPTFSVGPVFTGPAARCQYKSLPLRDLPPLGMVRQARLALEDSRERRSGVPAPGRASAFSAGDWVRVKDADAVRATLDGRDRHRGLWFTASQWSYCGRTYQVEHVVRRMVDDHYRMRRSPPPPASGGRPASGRTGPRAAGWPVRCCSGTSGWSPPPRRPPIR
ncbi:hypothetical protein ACFQ0T_40650 [Kitasatospora gansuensis]